MDIKERIKQKIDEIFPQIVAFRRDLHAHPELSGQEDRTSRRIAEELEKLGIEPHVTPEKAVFGTVFGRRHARLRPRYAHSDAARHGYGAAESVRGVRRQF